MTGKPDAPAPIAERMARLAEVLVDVDDRIAAEDAAAAQGQRRLTRECR